MNLALSGLASDDELDNEDKINAMVEGRCPRRNIRLSFTILGHGGKYKWRQTRQHFSMTIP